MRFHPKAAACLLAMLAATVLHADPAVTPAKGWHVLLRSGFDLTCARMDANGETTRLFLHSGTDDFLDVRSADIVETEQVELPLPPEEMPVASATLANEPAGRFDVGHLASAAGTRNNLDPDLIASVIHAESAGNPRAVSHAGARGLMQLMPATAGQLGVRDTFDPLQNVNGGTDYLNRLLVMYHDNLQLALAAYNAGPGAVAKYHGIPPFRETQAYVARVIRDFNHRKLMALKAARAAQPPVEMARNAAR